MESVDGFVYYNSIVVYSYSDSAIEFYVKKKCTDNLSIIKHITYTVFYFCLFPNSSILILLHLRG